MNALKKSTIGGAKWLQTIIKVSNAGNDLRISTKSIFGD